MHGNVRAAGASPWVTGEQIREVYDADAASLELLRDVTADEVWEQLRDIDEPTRQMLLAAIGLHTNRTPPRAAAAQLLARLRTGAGEVRGMRASLEPRVIKSFDGSLGPVGWSLLLAADTAHASLLISQDPSLFLALNALLTRANPKLTPLALMGAITSDLGVPALALGLLALGDPAAQRAWEQLEAQGADLPPAPVRTLQELNEIITETPLLESEGHPLPLPGEPPQTLAPLEDFDAAELLQDFDRVLGLIGADVDEAATSRTAGDEEDDDDVGWDEAERQRLTGLMTETADALGGDVEDSALASVALRENVTDWAVSQIQRARLLGRVIIPDEMSTVDDWASARMLFAVAARLTDRAARQLEVGDRPESLRDVTAMLQVLSHLELPDVGAAAWLDGRLRDAQVAADAAAQASQDREWLTELTNLDGPASLNAELHRVADAASAHLTGQESPNPAGLTQSSRPELGDLRTLHHFLRISAAKAAGAEISFDELFSSEGAARQAWPDLVGLLSAATSGYLSMPVTAGSMTTSEDGSALGGLEPSGPDGSAMDAGRGPDDEGRLSEPPDWGDGSEDLVADEDADVHHAKGHASSGTDGQQQTAETTVSVNESHPSTHGQEADAVGVWHGTRANMDEVDADGVEAAAPRCAELSTPVDDDLTARDAPDHDVNDDVNAGNGEYERIDGDKDGGSTDSADLVGDLSVAELTALDELLADGAAAALMPGRSRASVTISQPSKSPVSPAPAAMQTASGQMGTELVPDKEDPEGAGPDGSVESSQPAAAEGEELDWNSGTVQDAAAAAAADLRFGLAADIALAAGAPQAVVSARRLVAYAHELRNPSGPLAAAFSEEAATLSRDGLSDDRDGQLIAWAAAARVALLAPHAGPARVLTELAPCVADLPGLSTIGEALVEASRNGVVVVPEAGVALGTVTDAERALENAVARLNVLLETSGRRTLNYQPANAIYQEWLLSTGPLGAALLSAASGTVEDVAHIRQTVLHLRGEGPRRAREAHRRAKRSNKIHEPVMRDLIARWEDILDALEAWCEAVTRVQSTTERASTGSWQTAALADLRSRISPKVREQALAGLAVEEDEDPRGACIAEAVTELLSETFSACDGQAPAGDEPAPALAVHADLLPLAIPGLPAELEITDVAQLSPHLPAMLALAEDEAPSPEETYRRLKDAGHHDQTALLIALSRTTDPRTAAVLDRDRGLDVADRLTRRTAVISTLRRRLDTQRMSGGLTEEDWSSLSTRVDGLGEESRRDFGQILLTSEQIQAELDRLQAARIAETIARIDERAAASPLVAEEAERLTQLAEQGNIASAEEYLEQLGSGESLPDDEADHNVHLARFYPAIPDVFETELKSAEQFAAFTRNPELAHQLTQPAASGPAAAVSKAGTSALAALQKAGLDLAGMPRGRVDEARRAFDGMRELAQNANSKRFPTASLLHVLTQAGFDFARAEPEAPTQGRRRWVTLIGVNGTGRALTPALGSAKSPDGTSLRVLLVWGEQQPQSLIDWVRDEAPDRSVLALWLGTALTTEQRRSLAEAARGRPKPLVAVLDLAALTYLSVQPVRNLATFASIALPFTAMSPYKDTPGVAAPEMFYGRRQELEQVKDLTGPSFVSGGRQLGKSALLRAAEARFPTEGPGRVAILRSIYPIGQDGDSSTLWPALWADLREKGITSGQLPHEDVADAVDVAIRAWIRADASRALLILLDEADAFLDADADGNLFRAVNRCRDLMLETGHRVKFVFAGLHRTARFDSLPNQPLSHLRQITVGPLAPRHAHDLITRPLAAIGFTYQDTIGTPARILALANNMPALLQLFGAALVRHLTSRTLGPGMPPDRITDEDVEAVWADPDLRLEFREKYVLTLNLDHRFLVIAYTIAYAAHLYGPGHGLTLNELSEETRSTWPEGFAACSADDFRALVTECVDLGLLARDGNRYRMRTPTVLRLLGTQEEVLDTLTSASDRLTVPTPGQAGSYRRRSGSGRSPLTERQLADVLAGLGHATLITGGEATGLGCVADALSDALSSGDVTTQARSLDVLSGSRIVDVAAAVKAAAEGTVVLVDTRGANAATLAGLAAAAEGAAAGTRVGIVLLADASSARSWPEVARRVSLSRVDVAGLRLLCDEEGLPFHDDASVTRLHEVTGGWPELVAHALTLNSNSPGVTLESVLTEAQRHTAAHQGALVKSVFADRAGLLGAVFDKVAELTEGGPEDATTVAEMLVLDEELMSRLEQARVSRPVPGPGPRPASAVPLSRRSVEDENLADIDALLATLADLDVIMTAPNGAIGAEPVLTAAHAATRPRAGARR